MISPKAQNKNSVSAKPMLGAAPDAALEQAHVASAKSGITTLHTGISNTWINHRLPCSIAQIVSRRSAYPSNQLHFSYFVCYCFLDTCMLVYMTAIDTISALPYQATALIRDMQKSRLANHKNNIKRVANLLCHRHNKRNITAINRARQEQSRCKTAKV